MPSSIFFLRVTIVLWGLFGILSGCFSVPQIKTPIHESSQGQIILKTFTDTSSKISHPTNIDIKLLKETLRGLHIQEQKELLATLVSGEGKKLLVFTEQEIQFLAPFLNDALTQATPEEYVWFRLIDQKQSGHPSTSGVIYFSNNLLRVGLNEFQADSRHTRLSSRASFSSTRLQNWTLGFSPVEANLQDSNARETSPIQTQIGSVAIEINVLKNFKLRKPSHPQPRLKTKNNKTNEIQGLKEEIGELQQQLEGQDKKLRHLEKRLEQDN